MKKNKKVYRPEFKAKVVMELISGQKTLNELAGYYQIAPATLSAWHKQFQERAIEAFTKKEFAAEKTVKEQEEEIMLLHQKVGQLTVENDWLKKKSDEIFGPEGTHRTRFRK